MCLHGEAEEEILWTHLRDSAQGLARALDSLAQVHKGQGGRGAAVEEARNAVAVALAALATASGDEAEITAFAPHHHHEE